MVDIKIKLLREGARVPEKKSEGAAGFDLYLPHDVTVKQGTQAIPMGFALAIPLGWKGTIKARSGNDLKGYEGFMDIDPYHTPLRFDCDVKIGTIDSDYRGECCTILESHSPFPFVLRKGYRIAQLLIERDDACKFTQADELDETERGSGGFGHTGN